MIESYTFGRIVIDGKTYTSDVIIYKDKVDDNWWRKSGHLLQKEDLKDIIDYEPEVIIIGTGASGLMKVPDETKEFIESNGIEVITAETDKAYKEFNNLCKKKRIVAAFHLTC
jgi:hypothetical protein